MKINVTYARTLRSQLNRLNFVDQPDTERHNHKISRESHVNCIFLGVIVIVV